MTGVAPEPLMSAGCAGRVLVAQAHAESVVVVRGRHCGQHEIERLGRHQRLVAKQPLEEFVEVVERRDVTAGGKSLELVSDVSNPDSVDDLVKRTLDEFGRVDFIINNAGAARGSDRVPVVDLAPEDWHKVMNVNLNGTFYMSRAFGRVLIEQGEGGAIVNISSIAGKRLPPNTAAYAASKAAIQALTASMAQETGQFGVRVNAICPGIIDTYRMDDLGRTESWQSMIERLIPLRRAGSGDDIAAMVAFLCSDQGSWITGQSYNVDGGSVVQH